ncbi:MAG: hypothetical protein FVQ80_07260 [Planctomycetes bacterium]|nr:hypothetical protein [Planctomycetota bacterium]
MAFLTLLITWINIATNALGKHAFSMIAVLPGWLSNTIISAVLGVIILLLIKYTSNQKAISQAKDYIKANMLALKLFKDSLAVTFISLGKLFKGVFLRLGLMLKPLLIMFIPFTLIVCQLGLWYQARPMTTGEEAMVILQLAGEIGSPMPNVAIQPTSAMDVTVGPVRAVSNRQVFWIIKAKENGTHNLTFNIDGQQVEKQLVIGEGFKRVSLERPGQNAYDIMLHPMEEPLKSDSIIQSISIEYPDRISKTSGTDWWVGYLTVVSMAFAVICMPIFKVKI